jgi:GNAT superfamily N-acetyltransferase
MPLQPSPLLRGFEQGADGEDVWNRMMPGEERGPLTLDPQGVALGQQFQAIKAGIEAQQARPIWDQNNPVGTETVQSMGMPQPTVYAGAVGQFIDPATGRMTEQGAARMENPMLGVDTGGVGAMTKLSRAERFWDAFDDAHAASPHSGVSHMKFHEQGPSELEIQHIQVDPSRRGQGIGNDLMRTATDLADEHGVTLHASPASDADGAAGLDTGALYDWYQRWGFDTPGGGDRLTRFPASRARDE